MRGVAIHVRITDSCSEHEESCERSSHTLGTTEVAETIYSCSEHEESCERSSYTCKNY